MKIARDADPDAALEAERTTNRETKARQRATDSQSDSDADPKGRQKKATAAHCGPDSNADPSDDEDPRPVASPRWGVRVEW